MTAQELREKLLSKWADHVEYGYEPDTREFGESLIDIICSQREALEEIRTRMSLCNMTTLPINVRELDGSISMHRPKSNEGHAYDKANEALSQTDARLKSMGVL